jgi:hypothetical protein
MNRYKNEPFNIPSNDEVIERVKKAESLVAINKKLKAQNEILLRAVYEVSGKTWTTCFCSGIADEALKKIKELEREC